MVPASATSNTLVSGYLAQLRQHRPDFAARYHVASRGIFGSYVRNEQQADSDLDVLVTFAQTPSLLTLIALQEELSALLDVSVDLVMKTSLKPHIGQWILRDVVEV